MVAITRFLAHAFAPLVLAAATTLVWAQPLLAPAIKPAPAPKAAAEPAASAPIPLAEVPDRAEAVTAEIRALQADFAKDPVIARIATSLPELVKEIDALEKDTNLATRTDLSLNVVQQLTTGWHKLRAELADWRRDLTTRTARAEKEGVRLATLEKEWTATLALARAPDAPTAVRNRVQTALDTISKARAAFDRGQAEAITLFDQIARQDGRVNAALETLETARSKAVGRLFARQSPPIWQPDAIERAKQGAISAEEAAADQFGELVDYARRNAETLALHVFMIVLIAAILFAVRRRVHQRAATLPTLAPAAAVFDMPIAAAIVLTVLGSRWIYTEAPRSLWAVLGAVALIATLVILRRSGDQRLLPILYAVVAFYVVDQVRSLASTLPLMSRLLFIVEMLAGALFALYFTRWVARAEHREGPLSRWTHRGAWLVFALFLAAAAANVLGLTSLADLLARGLLGGAYSGVILYAAALVLNAILLIALHARPLALSRTVQTHTDRIWHLTRHFVRWLAVFFWAWLALDRLTLLDPLLDGVRHTFAMGFKLGSLDLTIGHLLAFGFTLWAAFSVSRFVRFVLEEGVFTRVYLPSGVPYAIARTTHYLIVVVGFLVALAVLGIDMTKFTIIIGALTVGIGFGLQNIINNFVSGLILLFERPVKIGDVIQMDDQVGVVQRIGIRASVIRTASGADVILPNGKFISDRVTNWTRASNYRPIEIPIAVAGTSNAREVMALLVRVAASQPGVVKTPPPDALLAKFGADTLNFDLRVWTDRPENWTRVRSDVTLAVNEALNEAKIGIK
jgi:potassium efflux system protein